MEIDLFLEISQNSQENTCARNYFLKRVSGKGVFLWILRNLESKNFFFIEQLRWLLLNKLEE